MTRVGVSGAAGRMGRLTAETIAYATGFELAAAYDPDGAGRQVAGVEISATPEVMLDADVVVEFTNPEVVMENLRRWHAMGRHAVVGTSGFGEERLAEVDSFWDGTGGNCLIVPNFSIGAVVMMRLAEMDLYYVIEMPGEIMKAENGDLIVDEGRTYAKYDVLQLMTDGEYMIVESKELDLVAIGIVLAAVGLLVGGIGVAIVLREAMEKKKGGFGR